MGLVHSVLLGPPFDAADQVANSIFSGLTARTGIKKNNVASLNHSNITGRNQSDSDPKMSQIAAILSFK